MLSGSYPDEVGTDRTFGLFRYNTDGQIFEGYYDDGSGDAGWRTTGVVIDTDFDTFIEPELREKRGEIENSQCSIAERNDRSRIQAIIKGYGSPYNPSTTHQ